VYFEESPEGDVSVHIHSWEPELTVYSNIILQIGIVVGVLLVFAYVVQRQSEWRGSAENGRDEESLLDTQHSLKRPQ
jgi:beta-lactamase regulating signal transducer with metallopeptidase domain